MTFHFLLEFYEEGENEIWLCRSIKTFTSLHDQSS